MNEATLAAGEYNTLQPYLMVKNAAAALEFYKQALGAVERVRHMRPDGRVMHAEFSLGDTCVMMADEVPETEAWGSEHYGGSPVSLHMYVADCDTQYQQAIAAGAIPVREPSDQPYGDRMGGFRDPFGYTWWLATRKRA
jgi:PhnB protein